MEPRLTSNSQSSCLSLTSTVLLVCLTTPTKIFLRGRVRKIIQCCPQLTLVETLVAKLALPCAREG
jgi:hypothetical protein